MSEHNPTTWAECAAAGMSQSEAARHLGKHQTAAQWHIKRYGLVFRNGLADNGANLRGPKGDNWRYAKRATAKMTPNELGCYRALRQGPDKFSIDDALRLIGRADLIEEPQE